MSLEKPVVSAIFFQADTVKGYRFWDEAGVLANEYAQRFQSVAYGPQGVLHCSAPSDPGDTLSELRVGTQNIWLHYREGVSLNGMQQEAARTIDWIARAIHVTQFSRLGLRVNMLWGGASLEQVADVQRSRVLRTQEQRWDTIGKVTNGEIAVHIAADPLVVRIILVTVQNIRAQFQTKVPGGQEAVLPQQVVPLPDYSILLDADLADNHTTESIDTKPHLRRSIALLQEKIVPLVAQILDVEV